MRNIRRKIAIKINMIASLLYEDKEVVILSERECTLRRYCRARDLFNYTLDEYILESCMDEMQSLEKIIIKIIFGKANYVYSDFEGYFNMLYENYRKYNSHIRREL